MKLKPSSAFLPLILSAITAANATPVTRSSTADNLNLTGAWAGATLPTTANVATWDAASTLANSMGATNTWGGLNTALASGAVSIAGNNTLLLDHNTDADTLFDTGANAFTWGTQGVGGSFHINGVAGNNASTAAGATFSGSGTVTLSSTSNKNWSSNGNTNGVTHVNFTGTLALRGAAIPTVGLLSGNWLAFGGGGGAASDPGTTFQTGSFSLDTGDSSSCGSFILTQGWSGQLLKLNRLQGTGSIRADWGLTAGTQNRGIELDQSADTTLSGSILAHNGSGSRRNIDFVKKGIGTLTLSGGLGTSGGVASLNFDIQGGAIQLGDGNTTPVYQNPTLWDTASTFTIGSGAKLRFMAGSSFTWTRAITGGNGTIEITNDGTPGEGNVIFTASHSGFAGDVDLLDGSLRIGPNLGSGTLTVGTDTFISCGLPAANGTSQVGALVLEADSESDFRLGITNDRIDVTGALTPPASGTHIINIFNAPLSGGTIKLIDYDGPAIDPTGFSRFQLGLTPSGAATYQLVNNTAETSIDLVITLEDQLWTGSTDGNWDDSTTNWALEGTPGTPDQFNPDHPSVFGDNPATSNVIVGVNIFPFQWIFENTITDYTFTGEGISGGTFLEKNGGATVTLAQDNSYTGGSQINGGKLRIGNGGASGDIGSGAVTIASGAALEFNRSNASPGVPDLNYKTNAKLRDVSGTGDIILDGGLLLFNYTGSGEGFADANSWAGFSGNLNIRGGSEFLTIRNGATAMGTGDIILGNASTSGTLSSIEGNWAWTNDIQLVGNANRIDNRGLPGDRRTKLQGVISGSGNLTLSDSAAGMTNTDFGYILTGTNTMDGILTIDAGVPVRIGGVPGNVNANGTGLAAAASGTLGTGSVVNNGILTFSRTDAHTVSNPISGSGELRLGLPVGVNTGDTTTQVLSYTGTTSHTGATTLRNGTLIVGSGGSLGGSAVTVDAAATLGGTGTIAAALSAAGTIAPGISIGTLPVTGNATVTGTLAIEVDGPLADKLMVTGNLDLTGSTVGVAETGVGFTAASYVIAECSGTLSGTPAAPEGYALEISGNQLILTQSVASGYEAWAAINAGGQTADLDFDGDGVPNGVEYFMGETGSSFTANPTVVNTGGVLTVTWPRDPTATASFTVQTSSTLAAGAWTDIVPPHASIDESDPHQVVFTLPSGGPVNFCRLSVTP